MNQTEYFKEKIATLPEDLQEAIYASDYSKILADIQKENRLHIDQGQVLETLGTQLMFGDIDAPEFVNGMFNEAHVSSSVAGDILLKIDTLILRKIRTYIEDMEEIREKDRELEKLLMDDEELAEEEESTAYANYYVETAKILEDARNELIEQGIEPDGSNITDEMLAKAMGTSVEELSRRVKTGALQEARDWSATRSFTPNFESEKEELMREIESPEKVYSATIFTKKEVPVTPPDHQLKNVHVEIPYIEEIVEKPIPVQVPEPVILTPVEILKPVDPNVSTFKKPTKITLSIDPYKEPIE